MIDMIYILNLRKMINEISLKSKLGMEVVDTQNFHKPHIVTEASHVIMCSTKLKKMTHYIQCGMLSQISQYVRYDKELIKLKFIFLLCYKTLFDCT